MYPWVTCEMKYLALFHSISQQHILVANQCTQLQTQALAHRSEHNLSLTAHRYLFKNQQFVVAGVNGLLRRCDILLHWQTHFLTVKPNMQPNMSFSLSWDYSGWFHRRKSNLLLASVKSSMTVVFFLESPQMNVSVCATHLSCVQTRIGGAPMQLVKELMSTWYSPSFWMNDLHSQLLGFLHQTWPTLIINDSVGQCPIFTTESSIMPGQTNPPEFHHFQLLLTPK